MQCERDMTSKQEFGLTGQLAASGQATNQTQTNQNTTNPTSPAAEHTLLTPLRSRTAFSAPGPLSP
eukprot:7998882-Lingulodinium_polyedra.AAC.1